MKILFLHPNIPGQYKHLCVALAKDPANEVVFITKPKAGSIPSVRKVEYALQRDASPSTHRYLIGAEKAVLQGQEVWRVCKKLRSEGFVPDVICAHPGWGDALYVKDIYPQAKLLNYFEFYYHSQGADVGFDPSDPVTEDDKARIRTKNITNILSLESADWGITPTHWQWQQNPEPFRHKISVLHDGVDTQVAKPNPDVTMKLPGGRTLTAKDEIVTYVARNFEPYRGFPTFMRAAEIILKNRPNCHIIAVGADDVSYGKRPRSGTYRQEWMKKVKLPQDRIHFVGHLPYPEFLKTLQISSAHLYLTYPFVLSWSMLEAMSAQCLVIGSATAPVMEAIEDGRNGLLVDFFSPEDVAAKVDQVFAHKDRMQAIRQAARRTVLDKYDLEKLMPLHVGLVTDLAAGKIPPPTAKVIENLYEPQAQPAGKKARKA